MTQMRARWAIAAVLGGGLLLAACGGTTQATQVKVAPTPGALEKMKSTLVVGATGNPEARESYETRMVLELREEGVNAERSLDIVGTGELPKREELEQVVKERGFDTVVVAWFAGTRAEPRTVVSGGPYDPYYGGWYSPWSMGYSSFTTIEEYVMVDTLVYRTEGEAKPIFSARTETWEPSGAEDVVKGVVKASTEELKKTGLL